MDIKEKFYAKLDEISGAKARKSEHASAEVYYRAYDDETRKRRKAIKDKTPESKEAAEKAKEKREKAAKRTIRFQKYADKKEKKLEEGIMKKIKRSFQGWDKNATDLKGNPSRPKDVVKRAKKMGDEDAKAILKNLEKNVPSKHSPADLQYKTLKRRFKKK